MLKIQGFFGVRDGGIVKQQPLWHNGPADRLAAHMRNETIEPSREGDFKSQAEPILDDVIAPLGQSDRAGFCLTFAAYRGLIIFRI
jgi:hypothetical protein